ncbi:MAG: IPT/TIG domain-containing protein [Dehalococcoidia bacterium]
MRLLSRLVIAFAICLLAIALPAAPAQANGAEIRLSPSSGVPGEEVRVRGNNFTADKWVDIYYYLNGSRTPVAEAKTDGDGNFPWVTFEVPESYTGEHEVRAYIGTSLRAIEEFTVEPGLTVSPEESPVGTPAIVEGHGFAEDEEDIELRYYLDGDHEVIEDDITADADGSWQHSFKIPRSAKGSHKIDASGDESRLYEVKDATFEVIPKISIIDEPSGSAIDEPSGSVGDNITMTGSGFEADERDIKILFDGEAVVTEIRADERGYWKESFEVPEMSTGKYSITADGERTKQRDIDALSFEIEPGILLSPDQGHVGMNLTVTGRGFATDEDVSITYEDEERATATTNAEGSFEASFSVPESPHGERQVTAKDADQNVATANFTMESASPDTPELISAPDGARVGFIGKVRPTFEWSEVSDDSGVYYRLQIATSDNVTATGEFVDDPIVSVPDIVGANYTLNATEALPYGTYYWIVQAVDGAENAGNWTEAYSFRAGLLPLGGFIVIIVAIVVLIGAAVYFFLIRRRTYY